MISAMNMNSTQVILYVILGIVVFLGIQKLWRIILQKMENRLEQNAIIKSQQTIETNLNPTELDIILYVDNWVRKPTKDTEKPPLFFLQHANQFIPYLEKVMINYPDLEMQKKLSRLVEDIKIFAIQKSDL